MRTHLLHCAHSFLAIVLDVLLPGEHTFLETLKSAHNVYNVHMVSTEESRAKAKRTRTANLKKAELNSKQLVRARATARNAQRALKEYKAGMEAGIKLVTDAMRASN